jgi:sugar phosphate isomerase/epimerase
MRDELKLTRVELFPQHLSGMSPPQALQKMKDAGVTAVSYGVVPFTKDHEANRKLFEFAKTFGMSNLACDPDRDAFDSLDKLCDEYNITAAIHPHGPGSKWFEIKQIYDAVKDHNPKIGLCNDTGHLIRANQDPVEACAVFKGRLHDIHFKDFKKKPDGGWEDCVLGEGELKVDALTKALIDMNYKGVIALEYEGGDPVNASKKCLDRIKKAAAKAKQA